MKQPLKFPCIFCWFLIKTSRCCHFTRQGAPFIRIFLPSKLLFRVFEGPWSVDFILLLTFFLFPRDLWLFIYVDQLMICLVLLMSDLISYFISSCCFCFFVENFRFFSLFENLNFEIPRLLLKRQNFPRAHFSSLTAKFVICLILQLPKKKKFSSLLSCNYSLSPSSA